MERAVHLTQNVDSYILSQSRLSPGKFVYQRLPMFNRHRPVEKEAEPRVQSLGTEDGASSSKEPRGVRS